MNNELKIIWIDDDSGRKRESKNLGSHPNVSVEFIDVKKKILSNELNDILKNQMPDLILMDHMLNNVNGDGFKTGSTAAEVLREVWPNCPIVCITGVPLYDVDWHKKTIYEDVFEIDKISKYYTTLRSIATAFQKLKGESPNSLDEFINELIAPEDDKNRLRSVLPQELKSKEMYQDKSLLLNISKWVRHTLMKKPGFLYDRLWAATLIGIKEESFKKVEHFFTKAKYNGIFADDSNERWWQSKIRDIIFSEFPEDDSIYPWELGRKLPGITEDDYSKCYASGEDYPETVAYTDDAAKTRKAMRLRYTEPHPDFEKSLFFEEIRKMKGNDDD